MKHKSKKKKTTTKNEKTNKQTKTIKTNHLEYIKCIHVCYILLNK